MMLSLMSASDLSIRNPVFAWMLMIGLIVFGWVSFSRMGVSQLPDVDFPVVTVTITLQGAAPEVMEGSVADSLEDQLMTIQGLRTLTTVSSVGTLTATLEFELNRDIDSAVQEVQSKVTAAQRLLPPNIDPPVITKTNPDDQPILWLALTAKNKSPREMMTFSRDVIKDQFTVISGVGNVLLGGYVEPSMRIWVDPHKLSQKNIAITDVVNALKQENVELPGGDFNSGNQNYNMRTLGEAKNPKDFENIVVNQRVGTTVQDPTRIVRLHDLGTVEPGLEEITRLSRFNGVPAVGIGIIKQRGSNAVEVGKLAKAKVEELAKTLPEGYEIHVNFDTTRFIEDSIHELDFNLMLSAILTALACWLFLGSLSATLNVILAIPTSIMGAFIVLYFMGFTLNTFTLLGLSLAIGIVVDDAIMVLENIFRHNEEGKNRLEAAIIGAREIGFAAMAATVAIVAIFLPVAFMTGIIGKFFFQFGVTITTTVLLSLLEALTITPMRLSRFAKVHKRIDFIGRNFEKLMDKTRGGYAWLLALCLRRPWTVVITAIFIMAASFSSVQLLKKEFSPPQDQSIFIVRIKTDPGAAITFTDSLMKKAETFLKGRAEVLQYYVSVGGFSGSSFNTAFIFLTMKAPRDRPVDPKAGHKLSQQEFMAMVRQGISKIDPSLKVAVQDLSMRGFTATRGFPIEFTVRGPDWDQLWKYASQIMKDMDSAQMATDIDTDYLLGKPEVEVLPDRQKAALHGVTVEDIGTTIQAMVGGMRVNQYSEGGHRYYSMVQVPPPYQNLESLKTLLVGNARGNLIPLNQIVDQQVKPALQSITRIDRQRAISIFANPAPGHSQQDVLQFITDKQKELPPGYRIVFSGSAQTFQESFQSLIFALILGIFVSYMVLASQFNSFIDPISVLVALPFSVSGAFFSLLITRQSLNIYSMIGLILLMGIVKKNSILLVEFTNRVRDSSEKDVARALLTSCPIRLRPIIMTSLACIAAAIPQALSLGPGSETTIPMAIAIIGGVFVSTLLTLFVVPCVYELFSHLQKRQENRAAIQAAFSHVGEEGKQGIT
jgi:HAE1 family hydrophobic/amphiphilic exporter-1